MSSCPNALPSNDASPLEVPAAHNPNGLASSIFFYEKAEVVKLNVRL
jgi:hypothetical protein